MVPKVGDRIRFTKDFTIKHIDWCKSMYLENTIEKHFDKEFQVYNIVSVYIVGQNALKIFLRTDERDEVKICITLKGTFTHFNTIVFEPAECKIQQVKQLKYCWCNDPEIITTGFNTLIINVCKKCGNERK